MYRAIYISIFIFAISACQSQTENSKITGELGGPCDGCEALYEYGDRFLSSIDTLPGFEENNPKLKIVGTVFKSDGITPASGVIIYIYHTNTAGIYENFGSEEGWEKRHGIYRGWVRTGIDGKYKFYTFRPGSYPNSTEPQHIHITIKEQNKREYYIDAYVFDDDPLLTKPKRLSMANRGGSGIVKPSIEEDISTIERNIELGKNIPYYK